ncbi:MAG: NAD-dependent epimerase/dehydratase family protein, partial [Balneolaceae bacterium]|nr:NAD-dependent epimerase/dehydratase family protein [Balneolaceae bacterium]
YEESKFIAEKKIKDYVLKGLDAVIVNPTRVYGPGLLTKSNAVTYLISQYLEGKWRIIPGDGQTVANYTYIGDVVEGHILAMEKGAPGERYILGGENLSYNELFDHIKTLSGKNHRMINVPYSLIKIFSGFEMVRAKIANRDPLVTPAAVAAMKFDTARTVEKAKNELGYSVTEIGEGIDRTIEWIRKEYEQNSG